MSTQAKRGGCRGRTRTPDKNKVEMEKRCECSDEQRITCNHEEFECIFCPCDDFSEDRPAIQCPSCFIWYHYRCVGLEGLLPDDTVKMNGWLCYVCWAASSPIAPVPVSTVPGSQNNITVDIRQVIKEEMELLITTTVKSSVETAVNEAMTNSNKAVTESVKECKVAAEAAQKEIKTYAKSAKDNQRTLFQDFRRENTEKQKEIATVVIKETAKSAVSAGMQKIDSDNAEREKRKYNIMISDVQESTSKDKKVKTAEDKKFVTDSIGINRDDIMAVFRAGSELDKDGKVRTKPRPLIVELIDEEEVLHWTNEGKGYQTLSGYWINRDLCVADRVANFQARERRRTRMNHQQMTESADAQSSQQSNI